jgi:hypothetical protein
MKKGSAPNLEIPNEMRKPAQRSVAQARKAVEDLIAASRANS